MKGVIIGFGNMGRAHYERFKSLGVYIPVVVDPVSAGQREACERGIAVCHDLSFVPNPRSFDFIAICSPTNYHSSHLKAAMRHNLPIFVEKPVVRNNVEVSKLRKAEYKLPVFVGEVEHYNPAFSEFFNYNGTPDQIKISRKVDLEFFLKGTQPWFLDEQRSGGIVLDLMIHDINLLVAKYGVPAVGEVKAKQSKYRCIDEVWAELQFKGFKADLYCSWVYKGNNPIVSTILCGDLITTYSGYMTEGSLDRDPYTLELKAFIDSISTGKTHYSLDMYLDAIEVALKIAAKTKS